MVCYTVLFRKVPLIGRHRLTRGIRPSLGRLIEGTPLYYIARYQIKESRCPPPLWQIGSISRNCTEGHETLYSLSPRFARAVKTCAKKTRIFAIFQLVQLWTTSCTGMKKSKTQKEVFLCHVADFSRRFTRHEVSATGLQLVSVRPSRQDHETAWIAWKTTQPCTPPVQRRTAT